VPHPFDAELVVADLAEDIAISDGNEMEELIVATAARQGQAALLRDKGDEFKFADFDVHPWAVEEVVEAHIDRFEVEFPCLFGGRYKLEGEVPDQSAPCEEVEPA
jgi:hypothetical protein